MNNCDNKHNWKETLVVFLIMLFIIGIYTWIILYFFNSHNIREENIKIKNDSIEYKIRQIDSIHYNIIQRDSIIYKYKLKYIDDVNKAKNFNDSATIELFYSLLNDNSF